MELPLTGTAPYFISAAIIVAATGGVVVPGHYNVGREELIDRELYLTEYLAGVFLRIITAARAAGTFLLRHTVVIYRHE